MDVERELETLSDEELESVMQALVRNLAILNPDYAAVVTSEPVMTALIQQAGAQVGIEAAALVPPQQSRARILRSASRLAAADPALRSVLANHLASRRDVLLEPVTTAITVASIILLLSTHVRIELKRRSGKPVDWNVVVEKKPTTEAILKKVLGMLTPEP